MRPNNPESTDYEPVSRSPMSSGVNRENAGSNWEKVRGSKLARGAQDPELSPDVQKSESSARATRELQSTFVRPRETQLTKGRAVLKRGHTLSYVGLFLFTAFVYIRPYELFPSLVWLKSGAFWIAVFTLVAFVPTQLGLDNRLTIRSKEINLVLLLLIAGLLSVPLALDRLRAWNGFMDYLKVVLMFIVMVNVVRKERRLLAMFLLVLSVSCVLSMSAISDFRLGKLATQGVRIEGVIGGLFDNPNDLALHFVTICPIAIVLLLSSRNLQGKAFYLTCAALMIGGIVVTFSRGGFLGFVCSIGVLVLRIIRQNKWLIGVALPAACLLFVLLAPGGYGSRISNTSDDSAIARTDDLKRSIFIAVHHPLLGVGMDNYVLYSNHDKATHNAYTQVASEMGLPAMIIYLMFMVSSLKRLRKIRKDTAADRRRPRSFYLAVGLEASLIGYMVSSFFASVAYLWYVYYLVAYASCLHSLCQGEGADEQNFSYREESGDADRKWETFPGAVDI